VATSLNGLAIQLDIQGKHDEALALHREALGIRRGLFGPDDPAILESLNSIGVVLFYKGDFAGAESMWREVLEAERRRGGQRPKYAIALDNLANAMLEQGNFRGAEPLARESLDMRRRVYGDADSRVAYSLVTLGSILPPLGRAAEAEADLRDAVVILRRKFPRGHYTTSQALSLLGGCLMERGKYDEAEPMLLESEADLRGRRDEGEKELRAVRERLVRLYEATGKPEKAAAFRPQATPSP
jgi:tetratricopeptide (TPR) repeat protein